MARPIARERWIVALALSVVICLIVLIVAFRGYSLKLNSPLIDVEMHPVTVSGASSVPP